MQTQPLGMKMARSKMMMSTDIIIANNLVQICAECGFSSLCTILTLTYCEHCNADGLSIRYFWTDSIEWEDFNNVYIDDCYNPARWSTI